MSGGEENPIRGVSERVREVLADRADGNMEIDELVLGNNLFLNRIPILDKKSNVSAYRLDIVRAGADVALGAVDLTPPIAAILGLIDPASVLGDHNAIVATDPTFWNALSMKGRWTDRIVLQVSASALALDDNREGSKTGDQATPLCFRDLVIQGDSLRGLPPPSCVTIDAGSGKDKIIRTVKAVRGSGATIIATSVDTRQDFEMCSQAGADLFQGGFYTTPTTVGHKAVSPNQALLLELSTQTSRDEDIRSIEAIFKKNPDLTFGLMNLVQSAFYAVPKHVASIRQAVAMLGYDNLHKWASLMLFTIEQSDATSRVLFETALIRARTMELAASKLRDKGVSSSAYIVGVFSLIPALFNVPMAEILEKANFVEEIRVALLERSGTIGAMLAFLEGIERGDYHQTAASNDCGFSALDLLRARSAAVSEQGQAHPEIIQPTVTTARTRGIQASGYSFPASVAIARKPAVRVSWITRLLFLIGVTPRRRSTA
jgi:c-di-GMP phosphodiesterase